MTTYFDHNHTISPHHDAIVKEGWSYSHTRRVNGKKQHVYELDDYTVVVVQATNWPIYGGSASGPMIRFYHPSLFLRKKRGELYNSGGKHAEVYQAT